MGAARKLKPSRSEVLLAAMEKRRRELLLALAPTDLVAFVKLMWSVIEPTPLEWNWHMDIILKALQLQAEGDPDYRKLLITMPPGAAKSLLTDVLAPAWEWVQWPERRRLFVSNEGSLVERDALRCKDLVQSEDYRLIQRIHQHQQGRYSRAPDWKLKPNKQATPLFLNTAGGFRQSVPIFGRLTGKRADAITIDDPLDAKAVIHGSMDQIARRIEEVNTTIGTVLPTRVNRMAEARWTLIMQRLHQDDPAGVALEDGGWKVINLAMEFDPDDPLNHPDDPRTELGELMFPALFPQKELDELKKPTKLGLLHFDAQYNQRTRPPEGLRFKRGLFRYYDADPQRLWTALDSIYMTVDCANKPGRKNDWTVIEVWGRRGALTFLLDQIRVQVGYIGLKQAFEQMCAKWPTCRAKLVEDAGNGIPLIQEMQGRVQGVIGINPSRGGGKEVRAAWTETALQAHQMFIPRAKFAPWIGDYVEEHCAFPAGTHDDQVDATSQFHLWLAENAGDDALAVAERWKFLDEL